MNANSWKTKITLNQGETLKHEGRSTKGFMEEEDIDTYSILSAAGVKVGSVTVSSHTAVRGFRQTVQFTQKDANGNAVINESYRVI